MRCQIVHLAETDVPLLQAINGLFGTVFADPENYGSHPPSPGYLQNLLRNPGFIALAAVEDDEVIGALAAYELPKFEQERSEIYLYDLAVAGSRRRRGVATALIERLQAIGAERGAHVLYVQADKNPEDQPAIELYSKLGNLEDVFHFDIPVPRQPRAGD
ncbi:MAG: AAC(3)-I family aminoglycoside N-acetyltransferase [Verrucomicrobia bacterium]|nr:AAC(3)-I family aminoglycoside N-acetyltransferase [Verrucomicrobiota bacterium]